MNFIENKRVPVTMDAKSISNLGPKNEKTMCTPIFHEKVPKSKNMKSKFYRKSKGSLWPCIQRISQSSLAFAESDFQLEHGNGKTILLF